MSQTRWRVVHWRWCRRCTKVCLGHDTSLREWYPTAKRRWVMVRTDRRRPVQWISRDLNLGLDRKLLACIILSKYRSSWGVEILWRGPRGRARFKILLMAPCVTLVIRAISTCRRPSRGRLTMSCNISPEIWRGVVWTCKIAHQKVVWSDGIRMNLTPFAPSTDISHWLLMNLLTQSCMKCIPRQFLKEIHSSHFHKLQPHVSKSITANATDVAVRHCIYDQDKNLFCFYFTLSRAFQRL